MCMQCFRLDRRRLLSFLAAGIVASVGAFPGSSRAAASLSPDEVLAKLKAGNQKFLSTPQLCTADIARQRSSVAKAQSPWAMILTCSDSRVAPELIFGVLGLGELFVARNAGNMADTATMGTIEYGGEHLGTPFIVVLGHKSCGAVAAACDIAKQQIRLPGSIGPMVEAIVPAALSVANEPGDFVDNAVRESARRTAAKIADDSEIVQHLQQDWKIKVVAAYYDLDTGVVKFLS